MIEEPALGIVAHEPRARLRGRIEARDLKKVAIAGYNNFTADLEHGEVPQREMQVFYITELARQTRDPFQVLVATMISLRTKDAVTRAASARESLPGCSPRRAAGSGTLTAYKMSLNVEAIR